MIKAQFLEDSALYTKRPLKAKRFHVYNELAFYSKIADRVIRVPVGFKTDFASIPIPFRNLINVNGPHIHAAVIHDYLCVHKDELGISQKLADQIFLEAMECLDVWVVKRYAMYYGVRVYQTLKGFVQPVIWWILDGSYLYKIRRRVTLLP